MLRGAHRGVIIDDVQDLRAARVDGARETTRLPGAPEDRLYAATERNGLVAGDGQRQAWATIRSGLSKGLQEPKDLDADDRPPTRRRHRKGEKP